MFTRYWRNYPWFLQLFLFVMMMFTFLWLGRSLVWAMVPKLTGIPIKDILTIRKDSPLPVVRAALLANAAIHVFAFTIPPLVFANLTHPQPFRYLGLKLPGKPVHWLLVTGMMLGFLPLSLSLESWLQQHLNLGQWARDIQAETDNAFAAYLNMKSGTDLLKVFIAFAIIPPIGEELLFRSIIMRFAHKRAGFPALRPAIANLSGRQKQRRHGMLMPIILTATLFALMHPNPYGAPFIFSAGVLLAVIYWLTGSLLCSIWAHLLFNGSQVVGIYFQASGGAAVNSGAEAGFPIWLPIAGLALLLVSLYGLYKMKTPLPPDWSSDFTEAELSRPQ